MKILLPFTLCCTGFVVLFAATSFVFETPIPQIDALPAALYFPKEQKPQSDPITLLFVGDIMLDRGVEWEIKKNGGDWRWPFLKIADTLQKADLVFGNLESQISDKGTNVGSIYSFRADPKSIEGLSYAGFDVLSVANNHSFDYTKEAFEDSLSRLKQADIAYVGGGSSKEQAYGVLIKELEDIKIGFLGYTNAGSPGWAALETRGGIAWVDWNTMQDAMHNIAQAKENVDILVVSVHAGEEYQPQPNDFQKTFAQSSIDAGADLIIGHHPHVLQPLAQYKQGWIAYSLGNFVFDQNFSGETMQGAILKVVVEDKKIKGASLLPTRLTPSYQVELIVELIKND